MSHGFGILFNIVIQLELFPDMPYNLTYRVTKN